MNEYKLFTDGACWGNPGKAACGMVIQDKKGKEIFKGAVYLGESTNNITEYSALLEGLKIAHNLRLLKLKVYSDSELVIKQLNGKYKVKSLNLKELKDNILKTAEKFTSCDFNYTSRKNTEIPHNMAERMLKNQAP